MSGCEFLLHSFQDGQVFLVPLAIGVIPIVITIVAECLVAAKDRLTLHLLL